MCNNARSSITVYVDPFRRRVVDVFLGEPGNQVLADDAVQGPTLVAPGDLLPHGCQEPLRVEEPRHPENLTNR